MTTRLPQRHAERGTALLAVLGVLGVLTILLATLPTMAAVENALARRQRTRTQAHYLARGGVERALAQLANSADTTVTALPEGLTLQVHELSNFAGAAIGADPDLTRLRGRFAAIAQSVPPPVPDISAPQWWVAVATGTAGKRRTAQSRIAVLIHTMPQGAPRIVSWHEW